MSPREASRRHALALAAIAAGPALAAAPSTPRPSLDELISQLRNDSCRYSSRAFEVCERSPAGFGWLLGLVFRHHDEHRCPLGAARCLEAMGSEAAPAVPALVEALLQGPNDYDTGDGVVGTRSAIASALGAIGDPLAVDPLARALADARPYDRAAGASVRGEPAARAEILRALGRFGPAAARHRVVVASVLAERNADADFFAARRREFEESEAMRIAGEEIAARTPKGSSFVIPGDAVAETRGRIDRASEAYLRGLEDRAYDRVASAAAEALGKFGDRETIPLLRDTLANRGAAAAAARALAELGAADADTLDALEAILLSDEQGPSTRSAAARAIGAVGRERSVGPLSLVLRNPALTQPAAEALGAVGPAASPALPALRAILAERSLAVRTARGRTYSVEASRQLSGQIAARAAAP